MVPIIDVVVESSLHYCLSAGLNYFLWDGMKFGNAGRIIPIYYDSQQFGGVPGTDKKHVCR